MGRVVTHDLSRLGSRGMAADQDFSISNVLVSPVEFAAKIQDGVFDNTFGLIMREGTDDYSTAWTSGNPIQIFEYLAADGTSRIVASTATDLFEVTTTTKTSRVGALTPTAGDWKFLNFNGKVLGWQASHTPIVKTGAGNFAAITASTGTLPDGHAACAAFGRVWAVDDDKQTIRYCALLDETKWATADGGGSIDMRSVWTQGMDEVIAIESFGSNLVVFGRRHVIIWTDGSGSQLGLDPLNMYVTDTLDFVGAINRNAVILVGELDVVFWSTTGLRSLARTLQERASPANDISPFNRLYLASGVDLTSSTSMAAIRMAYYAVKGLVLVYAPGLSRVLVIDVKGSEPRTTQWFLGTVTALGTLKVGTLLFGVSTGLLGKMPAPQGNDFGAALSMIIESGWIDIRGEEKREQALKMLRGTAGNGLVNIEYKTDFSSTTLGSAVEIASASDAGRKFWMPLKGKGTHFRIYIKMGDILVSTKSIGSLFLYTKPMRVA